MGGTPLRTAGLILAAGRGTRLGGGKMLAEIDGRPMLQYVLDLAAEAELDPVVVVLGDDADDVERAMSWRGERRLHNPDPGRGISSSVTLGLAELGDAERVLVLLGDQPFLSVENVRVITGKPHDPARPIVVPRYAGVPGNPVLLEREAWPLAAELEGDRGMSQLFAAHPELVRHVDFEGTNPDIDTPADLSLSTSAGVVAAGYDALAERYSEWSAMVVDPARDRMLEEFAGRLPDRASILDLGCGPGTTWLGHPTATLDITGVDVSAQQLALARRSMPTATLIQADMTAIDFPAASFDGVLVLYAFNHVPRDRQPGLMASIRRWLRPSGLLLATFSASGDPDWRGEWLGVQMFFSGDDSAVNRDHLAQAGFVTLLDEEVVIEEPEGPARFQWVLAEVSRA